MERVTKTMAAVKAARAAQKTDVIVKASVPLNLDMHLDCVREAKTRRVTLAELIRVFISDGLKGARNGKR